MDPSRPPDPLADLLRMADLPAPSDDDPPLSCPPSFEALWHLSRLAAGQPPPQVPTVKQTLAWACGQGGDVDDAAVRWHLQRSVLVAEMLEGALEEEAISAVAPARLAAAGGAPPPEPPFPTIYSAPGIRMILGVDERDRLYVEVNAAEGRWRGLRATILLPDLPSPAELDLEPGSAAVLGSAVAILGAEPEFNPYASLVLRCGNGDHAALWMEGGA